MGIKTTDEQTITLKWKVVFPVVGFLLIVSNLFTRYITILLDNKDQIIYNDEAHRRRLKNAFELYEIKQELKECKNEREEP